MTMEREIIRLIATDRIDKPISSMSGKLKRAKPKIAKSLNLKDGEAYNGERVFAYVEGGETLKARGIKEGIEKFEAEFPRYGQILKGYIEEKRALTEVNLYFGMNRNCRLTTEDYLEVMENLGFTEATAERLYPELMNISYDLAKKRNETERSILIG